MGNWLNCLTITQYDTFLFFFYLTGVQQMHICIFFSSKMTDILISEFIQLQNAFDSLVFKVLNTKFGYKPE